MIRLRLFALALGLAVVGGPPLVHVCFSKVSFNQFQIQWLDLRNGRWEMESLRDFYQSAWTSGWEILTESKPDYPLSLSDPEEIFRFVIAWVPSYAVVYPTEEFYYWRTHLKDGTPIMGNLRIADLFEKRKMSFAVFQSRPTDLDRGESKILHREAPRDMVIDLLSSHQLKLSLLGRVLRFKVAKEAEVVRPDSLHLTEGEEYLGQILDESGVRFHFLYNHLERAFYDILNESKLSEKLHALGGGYFVGRRTGFVFANVPELNRKVLVGVDSYNSIQNNFFDGPGDQVPFRLKMRDRLHAAYPNTYLEGGIDEHGVYVKKPEWVRIAVAPFHDYVHIQDFLKDHEARGCKNLPLNNRTTCMTREWWNNERYRKWSLAKAGLAN